MKGREKLFILFCLSVLSGHLHACMAMISNIKSIIIQLRRRERMKAGEKMKRREERKGKGETRKGKDGRMGEREEGRKKIRNEESDGTYMQGGDEQQYSYHRPVREEKRREQRMERGKSEEGRKRRKQGRKREEGRKKERNEGSDGTYMHGEDKKEHSYHRPVPPPTTSSNAKQIKHNP